MRRNLLLFVLLLSATVLLHAQPHWSFKGTVIKMRTTDCPKQKSFVTAISGVPAPATATCPEYTVLSDKVVYVVVGRRAEEFVPLAEGVEFLIRKNELIIFSDDERTKSRFVIQEMTLRTDWEREEARKEVAAAMLEGSVNYDLRNPPRASSVSGSIR